MQNRKLSKLRCHCCKKMTSLDFLIQCKTSGCSFLFCHKCLTSRYKYSKVKVSSLPTAHWKCPVCARRCQCVNCIESGIAMPIKKKIMKRKRVIRCVRKKNRIRKPVFIIQNICDIKAPLSEKQTKELLTPIVHHKMLPISGMCYF